MPSKRDKKNSQGQKRDIAAENFGFGRDMVWNHPLFRPLMYGVDLVRNDRSICPKDGWAVVTAGGVIHVHPTRRGEPEEWAYVIAHCLLHLGFGHFVAREQWREWNAACDVYIEEFLARLKLGRAPDDFVHPMEVSGRTEERIYAELCLRGVPEYYRGDMVMEQGAQGAQWGRSVTDWQKALAEGLVAAVTSAINVAAGIEPRLGAGVSSSRGERARHWFINSYPLLGALAAAFNIIEDAAVCYRLDISVAAVNVEAREIYFNPAANLDELEYRFVMAHELLHVGLRHDARRQGRDHYLWNVACDYVINLWLVEMGVGEMPKFGVLYDKELKGLSAEAIYDRIVTDVRLYHKLATLRGVGLGDILEPGTPRWWELGDGVALDDFYRRAMSQGLSYHQESGRGFLPADMVEEIRALSQPPIAWDVELARWFDEHFSPPEKRRSYARQSRRQSSTPDIPRPHWVPKPGSEDGRTFGVLLDTSGSMESSLLAKALGAIASYSISREVPAARVVFCDAAAYDQGYMLPEEIAGRVKVRGRGGTVLQPGVDLLDRAEDFPRQGPLLIITDGQCDRLHIPRRDHAFLLPEGRDLPFVPRGKVFRIK